MPTGYNINNMLQTNNRIDEKSAQQRKRLDRFDYATLPLRAFLGITFAYAGLQKLANPAFFNSNSPISIQQQFKAYSLHSPIGSLLKPLIPYATSIGFIIALGELAVGIGTLIGLFSRVAAIGGLLISFSLFLTVSFHSSPYFTGSDIVFFFAWIPLIIAGRHNIFSLETYIINYADKLNQNAKSRYGQRQAEMDRRRFLSTSAVYTAAVGLILAGGSFIIGRLLSGNQKALSSVPNTPNLSAPSAPISHGTSTSQNPGSSVAPTNAPNTTVAGTVIGPASQVPMGKVAAFTDPYSGDPAYVLHLTSNNFVAFNAVCPHAGCTVQPVLSQSVFQCPCHGSQFDLSSGQVISGPASSNLTPVNIVLSNGIIYVTD